jgi:hypothetical protein
MGDTPSDSVTPVVPRGRSVQINIFIFGRDF